jgi:predicted DNA-binding transcriptional regulator AlpA
MNTRVKTNHQNPGNNARVDTKEGYRSLEESCPSVIMEVELPGVQKGSPLIHRGVSTENAAPKSNHSGASALREQPSDSSGETGQHKLVIDYAKKGRALTMKEVAQRCDASRATVYRWRNVLPKNERLIQTKIDGFIRVWEADLEEFLARYTQ